MRARIVDAALDPGVRAVGVVLAHVGDGRVVRNVVRIRFFLEAFAVDGDCGIGHAFFVVDGSHQAIKIFVEAFRVEFRGGFCVCEGFVEFVFRVVRERHFVFDEGVFGSFLFGLFVFGDSFVVLALFVKLHSLVD